MPDKPNFDYMKAVDYLDKFMPNNPPLATDGADLESTNIAPTLGKIPLALVEALIMSKKPAKILEIGTSVAETSIALGVIAKSYGGEVTTIEINRRIASAAIRNIQKAEVQDCVRLLVGDAAEVVNQLNGPFGLIIQDGAKDQYLPMLDRLIELLEPGGILVSDDILFPIMFDSEKAAILDSYNHALELNPLLKTSWLPIGDGVAISVKV